MAKEVKTWNIVDSGGYLHKERGDTILFEKGWVHISLEMRHKVSFFEPRVVRDADMVD